jgi:hypothetical protein
MTQRNLLGCVLALLLAGGGAGVKGQNQSNVSATNGNNSATTINASTPPLELARAAYNALGGEKLKSVKNMILRGSVELFAPNSTQSIPGGFVLVLAGDKLRLEVDARPAISFKQIFDGQRSYSSMPGVELPPASKFGIAALTKYDQTGYTVSAIPDRKKLRGFKITDSEGNVTEFYIDPVNGRVMEFLIPYGNYTFGTLNKKFKEVDGILIASNFTQRLEMPQGAFFADYNVKDIKLNQTFGDDVFEIPN